MPRVAIQLPYLESVIRQGTQEGVFRVDHPLEVGRLLIIGIRFMFDPGFFQWTPEKRGKRA